MELLISYNNIYNLFAEPSSYCFLASFWRAGVLLLEMKYDIFRNGDEGTWQEHLEWHSQHDIVDPYPSGTYQTFLNTHKDTKKTKKQVQ